VKYFHLLIVIFFSIGFFNVVAYSQESPKTDEPVNDIDLQIMCSDRAAIYFKRNLHEDDSQDYNTEYINHWNKKLGKCFIQITYKRRFKSEAEGG